MAIYDLAVLHRKAGEGDQVPLGGGGFPEWQSNCHKSPPQSAAQPTPYDTGEQMCRVREAAP